MKKYKTINLAARMMAEARWAGVSERSRSKQMKKVRANRGAMPLKGPRCYCGKHTWTMAITRRFNCCKREEYPK